LRIISRGSGCCEIRFSAVYTDGEGRKKKKEERCGWTVSLGFDNAPPFTIQKFVPKEGLKPAEANDVDYVAIHDNFEQQQELHCNNSQYYSYCCC
jgi:hypothetical protein